MELLNKVLFKIKGKEIKVRDLMIVILLLLLLLFGLRSCQTNEKKKVEDMKTDMIEDKCGFEKDNINNLNELLDRADLCSDEWFDDFDDYISRIEDQNEILSKKKGDSYKETLKVQKALLKSLKAFRDDQSNENVDAMKDAVKKYKKSYKKYCE